MISGVLKRPEVVHSLPYRCRDHLCSGTIWGGGGDCAGETCDVSHSISELNHTII